MNLPQFTIANSQLCMLRALNKRRREWFLDWLTFNYKVYMQIASITKRVKHNKHWITITNQNQYRNQISCQFHKLLCKSGITRGASKDSERERDRDKRKNKYGKIITQRHRAIDMKIEEAQLQCDVDDDVSTRWLWCKCKMKCMKYAARKKKYRKTKTRCK